MRILVIRTSAMGDVAMLAPVLSEIRKQYPEDEIVLVTRKIFKPFFSSEGINFFFPDLKGRHKGIGGIVRIFLDIRKQYPIDYVVDVHDVLRSKILRLFFRLSGVPVSIIDKGRKEKQAVIRGKRKVQLRHSVQRYADTFSRAGFPVDPSNKTSILPDADSLAKADALIDREAAYNIGIAPFAKHKLKMWPAENMIRLLQLISEEYNCRFWLFGGKEDSEQMKQFVEKISSATDLTDRLMLNEELALMSRLDFMISMDSSNMHMAALTGTKVISIWGGTDPMSGFGAWMQPDHYSIRIPIDDLNCRPCTTFGKGECARGDFACMRWLTPEMVFKRIKSLQIL